MPANSCSSISDSPPLVSVSVRRGLRTNRIIQSSSSFSINWLSFEPKRSRNVILDLANPQVEREIEDKLKEHDVPYSILEGVPVLNYACAFLRCRVQRRIRAGDHDLYIANVISAKAIDDFTLDEYWRFKTYKPVLYVGSIRPNPLITI